jgi:hypothetical protein
MPTSGGIYYADAATGSETNGYADIVNIAPSIALSPYNQAGDNTAFLSTIEAGWTFRLQIDASNYIEFVITWCAPVNAHYEFHCSSRTTVGTCPDLEYYELFADAPGPPTPTVSIALASSSIAENGGETAVIATLDITSSSTVTVNLAYTGTASNGADYSRSGTSITISAGETSGSASITSIDDTTFEGSETVIVDVSSVTNGTENGIQQVTLTITDNDTAPTVSIALASSSIAENGGTTAVIATLSNPSTQEVTVNLGYTGTASNGTDYSRSGTTITIAAGSTSGSASITSIDDTTFEGSETVIVDVSSVTNGTENGIQQVTLTITDNEQTARYGHVVALGVDGECVIPRAFAGETLRGGELIGGDPGPTICARVISEPESLGGAGRNLLRYDVASARVWAGVHDGTGNDPEALSGWSNKTDAIDLDEAITTALPWSGDHNGYNFAWQIPDELLDLVSVGDWLVVDIALDLESGDVCRVRFTARMVSEGV